MDMLQPAVNSDLSEKDFWEMTIAEVLRHMEGYKWRLRNKAQFDYNLANLIGISVGRIISPEAELPNVEDMYPALFDKTEADLEEEEKKREEVVIENSKNRFLEFATKYNARLKPKGGVNNDN